MADSPRPPLPEPGQLVSVRGLRCVVADVAASALPPGSLPAAGDWPQHLVTLSSVEDDAHGEELQVIWELEPGAAILDDANLPDLHGFDSPARLDAFLDAVRWGAVSSADVRALQAPFRSGVEIKDYQLDPLVRALQMPRVNLLIADDVGFGKTVEAGLVMQELIIRHRARRVLIVCPASLQIHWRDQMADKFGLEFRIVDGELMKTLRRTRGLHANPWSHFPRLIASVDFLKRDRPLRLLGEILPPPGAAAWPRTFDLLIVDEAHNVAPSGSGRYAVDSLRTQAIRRLAPHCEHRLFLTATPHNGYQESFSALLELIDNQRFARGVPPDERHKQAIMVRRMKSELLDWDGRPVFPTRRLLTLEVAYTDAERQAHAALQEYAALRRRRHGPNAGPWPLFGGDDDGSGPSTGADGGGEDAAEAGERMRFYAAEFVLKLLKKRLFSSPAAFGRTLDQHRRTLLAASEPQPAAAARPAQPGLLRQLIARAEEEYAEDEAAEDAVLDAVQSAAAFWPPPTAAESELLDKLARWAAGAVRRPDSRARRLLAFLEETLRPQGAWNDERVILFTEYRATQQWLQEMLVAAGLGGERLALLYGGMPDDAREAIKAAFQADPQTSPVRILLATDAASEGIDLQRHCHRLVHLEIPWNPNRLEQRNGRIDRYGQQHEPLIHHFVGAGYAERRNDPGDDLDDDPNDDPDDAPSDLEADLEFLARVAQKVDQIREDLGSVGAVIAAQVTAAMLGGRRRLDTAAAEAKAAPLRRQLKFERNLRQQIERLSAQLNESRQALRLYPQNLAAVVATALALAGQPPLQPVAAGGFPEARFPEAPAGPYSPLYRLPLLSGSWQRALGGLAHPHTGLPRPITFDHAVAAGRDDVVLAHLNHPLVQMSLRLLRAEVWSPLHRERLHHAAIRLLPDHQLRTPVVAAYARLVVTGGDGRRLHEEVITAGGEVREGRFRRWNVTEVRDLLESAAAAPVHPAGPQLQVRLLDIWPGVRPALLSALAARSDERTASLQKLLAERAAKESADIGSVLASLQEAIRAELDAPDMVQLDLPLWTGAERDQLQRNRAALARRLDEIPGELAQEQARIAAHFAGPQARLFPVAVSFFVPLHLNY